jgi:hypothetical protein
VLQSAANRPPGLRPGQTCEIRVGTEHFLLSGENGATTVRAGSAASADAVITVEPSVLFRLAAGRLDIAAAAAAAEIEGEHRLADDVLGMVAGSAQPPPATQPQPPREAG